MEKGTWFGMVGIFAREEAAAAVVGLTMYPSRLDLVDFLATLLIDKCAHVFLKKFSLLLEEY
jgi:hypothetical protein